MADEAATVAGSGASKRRRDVTNYVVMRRPRPTVVGRVSQADADAEAYARFVGSWGNASAHVGQRWEHVATDWAASRVGMTLGHAPDTYTLLHVEDLDKHEALHREVERVGVSCPDALFCGRDAAGRLVVQPVDYKVSLDTASFDQVEAARILDLATRGGEETATAIWSAAVSANGGPSPDDDPRVALLASLSSGALVPIDGLVVSPDTAFNRVHLRGPENRRRKRPLRQEDVLLVAVTPQEFLASLPGWPEAQVLLHLDGVRADLPGDLGMAERYARLGAGVLGALRLLAAPLFGPEPPSDSLAALRARAAGKHSSLGVLGPLQAERADRLNLMARRDKLLRFPFRFGALAEALGIPRPVEGDAAVRWSEALRMGIAALHEQHRQRIEARGLSLLSAGASDPETLDKLEHEWPVFKRQAHADMERWAQDERYRFRISTSSPSIRTS